MTVPPPARALSIRIALYGVVTLGAAFLMDRFVIQGLLLPVRIHGGSMVPSLLGRHFTHTCPACRYAFPFDEMPSPGIVCPNCGTVDRRDEGPAVPPAASPGQRVLLDRLSLRVRNPHRWEVVAFRRPDGQLSVKRVVGLPGENVAIRAGDIWVNDQMIRKPLAVLQSMLVPVHSDRCRGVRTTGGDPTHRWRSLAADISNAVASSATNASPWQPTAEGYHLSSPGPVTDHSQLAWLTYQHLACLPPPLGRAEKPVLDSYGFNQNVSRSLRTVTDLLLECDMQWTGAGAIIFRFLAAGKPMEILWTGDGSLVMSRDGEQLQATTRPRPMTGTGAIVVGFADGHAFLAIDAQIVIDHRVELSPDQRDGADRYEASPTRPFAISGQAVELHVSQLRLCRDVHYLQIPGQTKQWQLGNDQFLLLGDNSPISEDARQSNEYGVVAADQILGRLIPQGPLARISAATR